MRIALSICLVLALALVSSVVFAGFEDGLVLYLTLDEGEGDVAGDTSGNGHDGVISSPEWVAGKFGSALQFGGDGSGTFITVESTDDLNVNELTFTAWIFANNWNGTRQIVGKSVHGGCAGRVQYGLFSEDGVFRFRVESAGGAINIDSALPPTEEWVHIAITNDGGEGKIYIDGVETAAGVIPGELKTNADPWRIGQDCQRENYIFDGIIDEARLWNRAMDADEINDYKDTGASVILAVEPGGKMSTFWGGLKSR